MKSRSNGGIFDSIFWFDMFLLLFGYSCLGLPGMSQLRGPICGLTIIVGLFLYIYCIKTNFHALLATYIVLVAFWGALLGYLNGATITAIVLDLTIYMSMLHAIYLLCFAPETVFRYLKVACIASIICFAITYALSPVTMSSVISRASIATDSFVATSMFWPMTTVVLFATAFKDIDKKNTLYAYAYWALAIVFHSMYLKRAIFVESVFLFIALVWLYRRIYKKNILATVVRFVLLVAILSILIIVIVKVLFHYDILAIVERILERFNQVDETGTVRFVESQNYFSNADFFDILFGKGLGVVHGGLGKGNTALHIGITNLILKSGLFMIPVYVFMVIKTFCNIRRLSFNKNEWKLRMASTAVVIATVPSFCIFSNTWSTSPIFCFMWYVLFIACYGGKWINVKDDINI